MQLPENTTIDSQKIVEYQKLIGTIAYFLIEVQDLEEKIPLGLHLIGSQINAESINVFEDYNKGMMTRMAYEWTKNPDKSEKLFYQNITYELGLPDLNTQLEDEGRITIADIEQNKEARYFSFFKSRQIFSLLAFPLYKNGIYSGFITYNFKQKHQWQKDEIEALKVISITLSNTFERFQYQSFLTESEEKFRDIFDISSDALFILDYNLRFIDANHTAAVRFGYNRNELLSMKAHSIILNKFFDKAGNNTLHADKLKNAHLFDYSVTREGKIIPSEIISKKINYEGRKAILLIVRDTKDHQQSEREIVKAVIETEEKERKRFAKDLHDGLGPLLSSIKLYVNELQSDDLSAKEKFGMFKYINELIDESITNTRSISNNLMPTVIKDYGVISAIKSFITKVNASKQLYINFNDNHITERFDQTTEIIIYRILQELINNTIKHSEAQNIEITMNVKNEKIFIVYEDDGKGFDVQKTLNKKDKGIGLNNIITRAKSIGGNCIFKSKEGEGTTVKLEFEA